MILSLIYPYIIHPYFITGTLLAHLCNEAATHLEKEIPTGQYQIANTIYSLLLSGPFLPHRRGGWYVRYRQLQHDTMLNSYMYYSSYSSFNFTFTFIFNSTSLFDVFMIEKRF